MRRPRSRTVPLVLASPHSGADYPDEFLAASRLDPLTLRRSEDSFVDEIFAGGSRAGRAAARGPFPARLSRRQSRGLGTRPGDVRGPAAELRQHPLAAGADGARHDCPGGGERRGDLCPQAAFRRGASGGSRRCIIRIIRRCAAGAAIPRRHSAAICLIDCHSMPSAASEAGGQGGGRYRARRLPRRFLRAADRRGARDRFWPRRGFAVALNAPYAGGFTTGALRQPAARPACVADRDQPRRSTWTSAATAEKPGFERLAAEMTALVAASRAADAATASASRRAPPPNSIRLCDCGRRAIEPPRRRS